MIKGLVCKPFFFFKDNEVDDMLSTPILFEKKQRIFWHTQILAIAVTEKLGCLIFVL
jgi:hypothetical protein